MRRPRPIRLGCALLAALFASLSSAIAAPAAAPKPPTAQPAIDQLTKTIAWYRQFGSLQPMLDGAGDGLFFSRTRDNATKVLRLAFDFARAEVALLPEPAPTTGAAASAGTPSSPAFAKMADEAAARVKAVQAEEAGLRKSLETAKPAEREQLQADLDEARSKLRLAIARQDTLKSFAAFLRDAGGNASSGLGPAAQIDALERSVPELHGEETKASARGTAAAVEPPAPKKPASSGVVALTGELLSLRRKRAGLRAALAEGAALRTTIDKLRGPLTSDLRATLAAADQVAAAPSTGAAPTSVDDATTGRDSAQRIDQLTAHFKKVSAAVLPLGEQTVLLDAFTSGVTEWHASVDSEFDDVFRSLLLRVGLLLFAVTVILTASEFWRRATFRYVPDARRRAQFLLLRRIVVALALTFFIVFALVTEIGSIATFAGFITAGLAVALQNVILSVAAYFFLIGKYGVRVGDRVQISGINGDVIDIGLVRLHLMELGDDGQSTGRVVVFSNAVLFQPTANFFKQIPGSNFSWHQVSLTLSAGSDYKAAEERLMKAVQGVYERVRGSLDAQHARISKELTVTVSELKPRSRVRLIESGLEVVIRFPVPLESAVTIDDEVSRAVLAAVEATPQLNLVGSGSPKIEVVPPLATPQA